MLAPSTRVVAARYARPTYPAAAAQVASAMTGAPSTRCRLLPRSTTTREASTIAVEVAPIAAAVPLEMSTGRMMASVPESPTNNPTHHQVAGATAAARPRTRGVRRGEGSSPGQPPTTVAGARRLVVGLPVP